MAKKDEMAKKVEKLMQEPKKIRNIGIAAHIDHGKTTLTDNLLAGAGMISEELAGEQLYMDFVKQEQERGITIYSANVSMIHTFDDQEYLVNLIDTPGHVDFSGDVTRAMRAVDGAVVVACAVEGVMPQTETVIRQALKERVKPVLFINKTDRLIKELKLSPDDMQKRLMKIIDEVNGLILKYAEEEYGKKWLVNVKDGSVAFGSALKNWAISIPYMKKTNITFKDIIEMTNQGEEKKLAKKSPLHRIVLNMVVDHMPNPKVAQGYRIESIWKGDEDSEEGKAMRSMDPKGDLSGVVTKVNPDPHAGMVATARLFSGTLKAGQQVRLVGQHKDARVQQIAIYKGPQRVTMEEIPAGNIIAIVGIPDAFSGETLCDPKKPIKEFETIKHMFEPVVVKAVEPKNSKNLPKLISFLRKRGREDPELEVKINEETGEYLVCGLGELHIDAKVQRPLKEDLGIEITASSPIVVYRETVSKETPEEVEGKSSNKHNKFHVKLEPLEKPVFEAISSGDIKEERVKKAKEMAPDLIELGMSKEQARKVVDIYNRCLLINATKGIPYLTETMELVVDGFRKVMDEGPQCKEPCAGIKVLITDASLHEDAIHRGPAQIYPAVRECITGAMAQSGPTLLEPIQTIRVDAPEEEMGNAMKEIQNRRGQIIDSSTELGAAIIKAKVPVMEMMGFEAALKSATGGKGFFSIMDVSFKTLPTDLREKTIQEIRDRKGLKTEEEE